MKTLMQIAMECNSRYNLVKNCVIKEKILPTKIDGKLFFNKYQEDLIHHSLYFEGKITEITLESKLNKEIENE